MGKENDDSSSPFTESLNNIELKNTINVDIQQDKKASLPGSRNSFASSHGSANEPTESQSEKTRYSGDLEDGEEYEKKGSPYPILGACCFCLSIVVAITCIAVSTSLHEKTDTENKNVGYVFSSLLGAFLFSLFMCLCCTYYLGASKESWEIPAFSGIRKNFSNIVVLAGLLVEFVQICSFSFNRTKKFGGVDLYYINYIAVPLGDNSTTFETIYWTMFGIAFTPYIFIIIVRIIIFVYTTKKGENSAAGIVEKFQEKIYSVLWFLVNTLYFPVIGTMVSGTDCTYKDNSITLDSNEKIVCLEGRHIAILCCSMLALVVYYPAASFAQAQTQSISDIKFKPRIVFVMLQGKFVLVLIAIFFTSSYYVYYSGVLIINLILLVLNIVAQPCLVRWVNRMRTILFAMALWATVCSGIIQTWILDSETNKGPAVALLVVWGIMIIGFCVFFYLWSKLRGEKADGSKTGDLP